MLCVRASVSDTTVRPGRYLRFRIMNTFKLNQRCFKSEAPLECRAALPPSGAYRKPENLAPWMLIMSITFRLSVQSPSSSSSALFSAEGHFPCVIPPSQSRTSPQTSAPPLPSSPCSGAGHDHGPFVRRGLLRRHRHGPRAEVPQGGGASGLLQSAELHCCYQRSLCAAAARRDR